MASSFFHRFLLVVVILFTALWAQVVPGTEGAGMEWYSIEYVEVSPGSGSSSGGGGTSSSSFDTLIPTIPWQPNKRLAIDFSFGASTVFDSQRMLSGGTCDGRSMPSGLWLGQLIYVNVDCRDCTHTMQKDCLARGIVCTTELPAISFQGVFSLRMGCADQQAKYSRYVILSAAKQLVVGDGGFPNTDISSGPSSALQSSAGNLYLLSREQEAAVVVTSVMLCGVDVSQIRHNDGSLVSTGSYLSVNLTTSCLHVPDELLDALITWGNITCPSYQPGSSSGPSMKTSVQCYAAADVLPRLFLTLDNGVLELDLNWLLSPQGLSAPICLMSSGSIKDSLPYSENRYPLIVLGRRILEHLNVTFDRFQRTVQFRGPKSSKPKGRVCQLMSAAPCLDEEIYFPQLNQCRNPGCQILLFMKYRPETNTCHFNVVVLVFLVVPFVVLVSIEWYLLVVRGKIESKLLFRKRVD